MNNEKLREELRQAIHAAPTHPLAGLLNRAFVALGEQAQSVPDALRDAVEYLDENPYNEIGAGSILHRAMRDALAAAPSPAQGAWKWVPVELLEELRDAANEAHNEATRPNRMKFFAALVEKADAILDAPSAPAAQGWIPVSERLPDVEKGKHKFVLVSVYRARSKRSFVFMLTFANEFEVQNDGYFDGDAEYVYLSGWHDTNDEGDFFPLVKYDDADKVTHWMPLPAAPASAENKP